MRVSSVRPVTEGHAQIGFLLYLLGMTLAMTVANDCEHESPSEDMTDTLTERVERLVHPSKRALEWGHPLLSTTPTRVAIHDLALRIEALEHAVRELALEVQKFHDEPPIGSGTQLRNE
jgi:hypothetical protein